MMDLSAQAPNITNLDLNGLEINHAELIDRGGQVTNLIHARYHTPWREYFVPGSKPNGKVPYKIQDTPLMGRPTRLHVSVQRYQDPDGSTVQQRPHFIHPRFRMTKRLYDEIARRAMRDPLAYIAQDVGVSSDTVRRVVADLARESEQLFVKTAPRLVGIDGVHIKGYEIPVVTDIENHLIVDVFGKYGKSRKESSVLRELYEFNGRENVEVVCVDMGEPFLKCARQAFPNATLVIDKRHVQLLARDAMNEARNRVRNALTKKQKQEMRKDKKLINERPHKLDWEERNLLRGLRENNEVLDKAYYLKEKFFKIYNSKTREEAEAAYAEWENLANKRNAPREFQRVIQTVRDFYDPIFNYFDLDRPVTNGFPEAANGLLKHLERSCARSGYKLDTLRTLALYRHGPRSLDAHIARRDEFVLSEGTDPIGHEDLPAAMSGFAQIWEEMSGYVHDEDHMDHEPRS